MITSRSLPQLHTKVLLRALRMTRARNSSETMLVDSICTARGVKVSDVTESMMSDHARIVAAWLLGGVYGETESTVTIKQLKAELAKREHVPNKLESIALRKAKQLRGSQKGRKNR